MPTTRRPLGDAGLRRRRQGRHRPHAHPSRRRRACSPRTRPRGPVGHARARAVPARPRRRATRARPRRGGRACGRGRVGAGAALSVPHRRCGGARTRGSRRGGRQGTPHYCWQTAWVTFGTPRRAATTGPPSSPCSQTSRCGRHSAAIGIKSASIGSARRGPKTSWNRRSGRCPGGSAAISGGGWRSGDGSSS